MGEQDELEACSKASFNGKGGYSTPIGVCYKEKRESNKSMKRDRNPEGEGLHFEERGEFGSGD